MKHALNELKLLKFALESSILRKDPTKQSQLLEFFKRNCFFRDYIFLWQNLQNNLNNSKTNLNTNHMRFELASDDKTTTRVLKTTSLIADASVLTSLSNKYASLTSNAVSLQGEIL